MKKLFISLALSLTTVNMFSQTEVYNIFGEVILKEKIMGLNNVLQIPNPIKGIYLIKILESNKVIKTKKLVLE